METTVIIIFAASLLLCIISGNTIVYALVFGYVLFFAYGLWKRRQAVSIFKASMKGLKTVCPMLISFVLIGSMTALWRASGTIAFIVYHASGLMMPEIFVLCTFILCTALSVLTGTSFGTAATMGVICMTIGKAMGVNQILLGGAVLSGVFVGDRCSPMSTSALLVSGLTKTDIYVNIRNMIRSSAIPFMVTCFIYFILGLFGSRQGAVTQMRDVFGQNFNLNIAAVLPALLIIVFSLLRIKVRITMVFSILTAGLLGMLIQGLDVRTLTTTVIWGYHSANPELAVMINGGGIFSMVEVAVIVGISSTYAGIFEETGLLLGLESHIDSLMEKITPFGAVIATAAVTAMIACNQTLPIMLTKELCRKAAKTSEDMALMLEDTAVVIPPLIPWSIAGAVPLASIGAGKASILAACYLYMLPLWNYIVRRRNLRREQNI